MDGTQAANGCVGLLTKPQRQPHKPPDHRSSPISLDALTHSPPFTPPRSLLVGKKERNYLE